MRKNSLFFRSNSIKRKILVTIILLFFLTLLGATCCAQGNVEKYAPVLYFEGEETCYPISAEFQIEYSSLYEVGNSYSISDSPTAYDLSSYSSDIYQYYYLDNQRGSITNYNTIISDSQTWQNQNGNTVYYRTYSSGSTEVIQYWMFYAFNKGELNQHEGDWEMVQVVLRNDRPYSVGYSQHHGGQSATWEQAEPDGYHLKVYVARGSHANYLRSYSGKLGIASDYVGSNGRIIGPTGYTLVDLEDELWLDFGGKWGEIAEDEESAITASVLGQAGPEGPKYREYGSMWNDPLSWQSSISPANDNIFLAELFLYNFLLIFLIITAITLAVIGFRIYRRHKTYGLGPRIVSMLYIRGIDLSSIGNIICFVAIVMVFIGLFTPWYQISYGVSGDMVPEGFETAGLQNLLNVDGINGIQATMPGANGPSPIGSFSLPFSFIIGIGIILLIIATIGLPFSKKLGGKYIWKGVRLMIPFILIIVVIMAMGALIPSGYAGSDAGTSVNEILTPITRSPFGGETVIEFTEAGSAAQVEFQWGLGLGGWLLFIGGIVMLVAGILEVMAKTTFFQTKIPITTKGMPAGAPMPPPVQPMTPAQAPPPPKKEKSKKKEPKAMFCGECGKILEENATFCSECGKEV